MRVLLVCSASFRTGQTGDATQGRETVKALRAKGHEVRVALVSYAPLRFETDEGTPLDQTGLKTLVEWSDVVHLLPVNPLLAAVFRDLPKKPTLGSSIFWGGWERVVIAWRNAPTIKAKIHDALREMKPLLGYKMDYRGIDVFLPNSQAEGGRVIRYFKKSPNARFAAVPNGFVPPSEGKLAALARPVTVPSGDYIVVPGVFARRKNQLALIRALKDSPYPVVFMGGVLRDTPDFFARCEAEANDKMTFLGFVSSTSDEYWAVLKYARCACLPSDCETPGIAMIESAYAGARPVVSKNGGTCEYYGFDAEYLDPCSEVSIREAVNRAWNRGRLNEDASRWYARYTWEYCANVTLQAYETAMEGRL